jgi:hypothetical protein
MRLSLGAKSLLLFLLSVLFLLLLTLSESLLVGLSLSAEKTLNLLLLVLSAIIGIILGLMSIVRREPGLWMGILGALLNSLFALFHIFLISFAG